MKKNDTSKEIKLSDIKSLISRADLNRVIRYTNHYFREVTGYSQVKLIGSPDTITDHPDMPKIIYELMWDRIKNDEDMLAIIKYLTKNGDYYWAITIFKTKYHPITKEFNGYLALSHPVSKHAVKEIESFYEELREVEDKEDLLASQYHLISFLLEKDKTYDEYIEELTQQKDTLVDKLKSMTHILPSTMTKKRTHF